MKCPIGSYQPQSGQNSCVFCGPKKTTLRQGSINETQCIQKGLKKLLPFNVIQSYTK